MNVDYCIRSTYTMEIGERQANGEKEKESSDLHGIFNFLRMYYEGEVCTKLCMNTSCVKSWFQLKTA